MTDVLYFVANGYAMHNTCIEIDGETVHLRRFEG